MARGNQISNAVGTGPKAHSGGPEAHHYSAEFVCREENQSCSGGVFWIIYSFMDVLAFMHARHSVMGITGVGRRPTPEPPAGARMKGA